MRFVIVCLLIVVFSVGCSKDDDAGQSAIIMDSLAINEGSCVSKSYKLASFNYCVDSIWDSRCPEGGICIWQGQAIAKFNIAINNTAHVFKLRTKHSHTLGGYPTDTLIDGYRLFLLDVLPYPSTAQPMPPGPKKVVIKVVK